MRTSRTAGPRGFTLTELLVVIAIIGILITFILIAAADGVRRAEEKATLGLITKLDVGIAERIEAILLRHADVTTDHAAIAAIYTSTQTIPGPQRAQVLAQFDLVKAEMPDVFFVQNNPIGGHVYPFNFAAAPYLASTYSYGVPLGAVYGPSGNTTVGMFGATYQAAAGLYKNLGYLPTGYDGADNNNDGFIDDLTEGVGANPSVPDPDHPASTIPLQTLITNRLAKHTHKTARSEMLYALLVEGIGPLGSVFTRDEFTNREVGDTDGDGLPEFIDAWGEPLQFYRWPIFYNPEPATGSNIPIYVQKGNLPYSSISEPRQIDPLDPNQTTVALGWWTSAVNSSPPAGLASYGTGGQSSAAANLFMTHFHSLLDPNYAGASTAGHYWDRGGSTARRSYFSRFLVLSGGPGKVPGTYLLGDPVTSPTPLVVGTSALPAENNALIVSYDDATDDITNQGLASPGGGVR